MELSQVELAVVTKAVDNADQLAVAELQDLQLLMLGGGMADVVFG